MSSSSTDCNDTVLFFDGICHLCHGSVNFLLDHGVHEKVRFAPLQSEIAEKLLKPHGINPSKLNSLILLDGCKIFEADDAVLQISAYLPGIWKFFSWLKIVPRPIRRTLYFFVAKRRYKWFGKYEMCRLPGAGSRQRFLE